MFYSAVSLTLVKEDRFIRIIIIQNLIYTQVKTGSKHRPETDEDRSTERKTWQLVCTIGERKNQSMWRCKNKTFNNKTNKRYGCKIVRC